VEGRCSPLHRGHEIPRPWRLAVNPHRHPSQPPTCAEHIPEPRTQLRGLTVSLGVLPEGDIPTSGDRPRVARPVTLLVSRESNGCSERGPSAPCSPAADL
jgi:hypothetical protein